MQSHSKIGRFLSETDIQSSDIVEGNLINNTLIHRDYTDTSNLQIRVYDDKLVMYNGATLSREVPIEKFDQPHQSRPFNPTMAAVFYKCGYIENWGRGTLNIIDDCLQAGLPKPEFAYDWGAARTTFYRKQGQGEGVTEGVTGGVKELLDLIWKSPGQRAPYFSQELDTSVKNIERWLKTLREQKLIEFRGAPKTGGYFIIEN